MRWAGDLGVHGPAGTGRTEGDLGPSFREFGKSQAWTPTRHEVSVGDTQLENTVSSDGGGTSRCAGTQGGGHMEREGTPGSDTAWIPPRMPGIPASSAGIRYKSETHSPERGGTPGSRLCPAWGVRSLRSESLSHLRNGTATHLTGHAAHPGVFLPLPHPVSSS